MVNDKVKSINLPTAEPCEAKMLPVYFGKTVYIEEVLPHNPGLLDANADITKNHRTLFL